MQELKTKNTQNENFIIDEIIHVLEKHSLTISEANKILYVTTKRLCQQPVKSFS